MCVLVFGQEESRFNDYFLDIDFIDPVRQLRITGSIDAAEFQTSLVAFLNFKSGELRPPSPLSIAIPLCELTSLHHQVVLKDCSGLVLSALLICSALLPHKFAHLLDDSLRYYDLLNPIEQEVAISSWLFDRALIFARERV